jgi:hypothetical protein
MILTTSSRSSYLNSPTGCAGGSGECRFWPQQLYRSKGLPQIKGIRGSVQFSLLCRSHRRILTPI